MIAASTADLGWMVGPGIATGVGGLFLLVVRRPSGLVLDTMLGFTAGVMLAATVFSLLVPALERGSLAEVVGGFLLGCGALAALDRLVPHAHARFAEAGKPLFASSESQRATLLLSALTIHNVPEGMAVGVAFAAGGPELGIPIALAIGIQNIPEGFAAAAPLVPLGVSTGRTVGVAALTGLVEPPAALIAYAAFDVASVLLAGALAFAAGAMLYVVVDEIIPEAHARGYQAAATAALVAGFVVMMTLDNAL